MPFSTAAASSYPSTTNSPLKNSGNCSSTPERVSSSPNIQSGGNSPSRHCVTPQQISRPFSSPKHHQKLIFPAQFAGKNFAAPGNLLSFLDSAATWPPSSIPLAPAAAQKAA